MIDTAKHLNKLTHTPLLQPTHTLHEVLNSAQSPLCTKLWVDKVLRGIVKHCLVKEDPSICVTHRHKQISTHTHIHTLKCYITNSRFICKQHNLQCVQFKTHFFISILSSIILKFNFKFFLFKFVLIRGGSQWPTSNPTTD